MLSISWVVVTPYGTLNDQRLFVDLPLITARTLTLPPRTPSFHYSRSHPWPPSGNQDVFLKFLPAGILSKLLSVRRNYAEGSW